MSGRVTKANTLLTGQESQQDIKGGDTKLTSMRISTPTPTSYASVTRPGPNLVSNIRSKDNEGLNSPHHEESKESREDVGLSGVERLDCWEWWWLKGGKRELSTG
ncbi:hypothetical protein PM082_021286 [Marasmius tenuissimus]|nr:hypothetical protein PM082_021286 [Marasmius tenuissimus]